MMKSSSVLTAWVHSIIAIFGLVIGYPIMGSYFMYMMIPYLIYMIFSKQACYFPAIVLHVSAGAVGIVVFICFALLSVFNYNKYDKKIKIIFWLLILVLPNMIFYVLQRHIIDGDVLAFAITKVEYYLAFFVFFYGIAISSSMTKAIIRVLFTVLFICFLLNLFTIINFSRMYGFSTYYAFGIISIVICRRLKDNFLLAIALFSAVFLFLNSYDSTFTVLGISLFSLLLPIYYYNGKFRQIRRITGILAFVLIIGIYYFGITEYQNSNVILDNELQGINLKSFHDVLSRIQFKLFADRAPFWAGGWNQIMEYKSLFPIHNMPDITAELLNGNSLEVSFGAHTSIIQLIRNYGILVGGILVSCYVSLVLFARHVFDFPHLSGLFVVLYTVAITSTIIVCLMGTYAMMFQSALLTFGVMGIAYASITKDYKNIS